MVQIWLFYQNQSYLPHKGDIENEKIIQKESNKLYNQIQTNEGDKTKKQIPSNAKENFTYGGLGPNFNQQWEQKLNKKEENDI